METPRYKFTELERDNVYEPAEDTFLLLDALEADATKLTQTKSSICLEIGSGSGVVSCFMTNILHSNAVYFCTDLNPVAANCTKNTGGLNFGYKNNIMPVVTDLCSCFIPRLYDNVDILLFNPPYVPTDSAELSLLSRSWAGGQKGREVLDRLLPQVPKLLSPIGIFYLIALEENDIPELLNFCNDLVGQIVISRRCGNEMLYVLKFTR